jgi:hypothetical protein
LEWFDGNGNPSVRRLLDCEVDRLVALASPTVTDIEPLHDSVRLSRPVDSVTILLPSSYIGFFDFAGSGLASLRSATVTLFSAYLASELLQLP